MAVGAGLAAAVVFGFASAVQHDQVVQVDGAGALDPGLLAALVRRPIWLLGIGGDALAIGLQAVGLRFGPVLLIQLLVLGGLPIGVLLSAAGARRRLRWPEGVGLALCTGGVALAVPASATVNLGHPAAARAWVAAAVGIGVAVVALLWLAHRAPPVAPLATGIAAGITGGTGSVLLAICAAGVGRPLALLTTATPYVAALLGLWTLHLSQAAFQTPSLAAPLAGLSVTEPVVACLLAVTVLQEHLPAGSLAKAVGALGFSLAIAGVVLLSRARDEQVTVSTV